jgi:hypothetical protein
LCVRFALFSPKFKQKLFLKNIVYNIIILTIFIKTKMIENNLFNDYLTDKISIDTLIIELDKIQEKSIKTRCYLHPLFIL